MSSTFSSLPLKPACDCTKLHQLPGVARFSRSIRIFRPPATGLAAEQACRNDPGIVEDQQILVIRQVWQVSQIADRFSGQRPDQNVQQSGRRTLG